MYFARKSLHILTAFFIAFAIIIPLSVKVGLKRFVYAQAQAQVEERVINEFAEDMTNDQDFTAGEVLVKYKNSDEIKKLDLEGNEQPETDAVEVAQTQEQKDQVKNSLEDILHDDEVEFVQPNYIYEASAWTQTSTKAKPGDYNDSNHWYYSQSQLPEMWKYQNCPSGGDCGGDSSITVAVIDTGLAFEAFDDTGGLTNATYLASGEYSGISLFTNNNETAGDGLDNDCNGYVDDYNGLDAYAAELLGTNTCSGSTPLVVSGAYKKAGHPVDTYGHGSLVTGTIASATDNGAGSVSPAFEVTIMPIAANVHFNRSFTSNSLIMAVNYARVNGADIINMSLGGKGQDSAFKTALDNAYNAGVLLIAASGNTSVALGIQEDTLVYPASYSNVISVGAVNSNNSKSYYSVYGSGVDLMAYVGQGSSPGNAIWQTTVSCYTACNSGNIDSGISQRFSIGTSFAAPQVAGLAALIKSENPSFSNLQIKNQMLNSATDISYVGWDTQTGWGIINFYRGLSVIDTSTPTMQSPVAVYRFLNRALKVHFYTASSAERDFVLTTLASDWEYEGIGFRTYHTQVAGAKPVYRFLQRDLKVHFYTSNETEKNFVLTALAGVWEYEGIAYYTYNGEGNTPLYRFLQRDLKVHFYTSSAEEKSFVETVLPSVWEYEGTVYSVK